MPALVSADGRFRDRESASHHRIHQHENGVEEVDMMSSSSIVHGVLDQAAIFEQLQEEGDYLIIRTAGSPARLFLVVKVQSKIVKIEVFHSPTHQGFVYRDGEPAVPEDDSSGSQSVTERRVRLEGGEITNAVMRHPVRKSFNHLDHKDLSMAEKIGRGSFGNVYAGFIVDRAVAVKKLVEKGGKKSPQLKKDVLKEAQVMSQVKGHDNVVELYGVVDHHQPFCLVMELCANGSLERLLRLDGEKVKTRDRICLALHAARGLHWLHENGIIHRDLAARNCLLTEQALKLSDFGMSRLEGDCLIDPNEPQNVRWMAPELWTTGRITYASDIFSFGVLLWELFVIPWHKPYDGLEGWQVKEQLLRGYRMPMPAGMPWTIAKIGKDCWKADPTMRPTASAICKELERILKSEVFDPLSCTRVFEHLAEKNKADEDEVRDA